MAEFKTYTCDICGKQGAAHLLIPGVDYQIDPADCSRDPLDGAVDLCYNHLPSLLDVFFRHVQTTKEQRRKIWKSLLNKV